MIILNGNTQKFQAVLAGAVNTDQPEFQATFGQLDSGVLDNYATNVGELNSTTDVNIVTGVASKQLGIKTVNVFNRDDASVTITFKIDISATDRFIYRVVLAPNESVHYESNRGWYVCNANGTERSASADDHIGQVTGASTLVLDPTAVTGQTELAAGLAGTDELILSDNGVLKRMDITVLEAYMEANIALPIGQVSGFTDNSTDWDAAFAFGDHAGAGYLTAIPTHTGDVTGDTDLSLVVAAITSQTALTTGLASTDELVLSDGGVIKRMDISVIEAYMEANIALPIAQVSGFTDNSTDWDAAFAFGDHAGAGYLTSEATHTGHVTGDAALVLAVAAITGQDEITSGLDGADELVLNDGGVIKRMDISVIEAYMLANLAFLTSFTETNDLSAAVVWADVPEANVPTHTGDVTGGTDLSLVVAAITTQTEVTTGLVGTDELIINDGGAIKRADLAVLEEYFAANLTGQKFGIQFFIATGADDTYILDQFASFGYTIVDAVAVTVSGTIAMAVKIDGVDVTGISAMAIADAESTDTASAANTAAAGTTVSLVFSSNSTALGLSVKLNCTRT